MPSTSTSTSTSTETIDDRPTWKHVAGAQAVVFILTSDGRPLAMIELRPGHGFHAMMCSGESLGHFDGLTDAQAAVDEWLMNNPRRAAA